MKRIYLPVLVCVLLIACNNSSDTKSEGADSGNSVVLPANRSSDSVPPNGSSSPTGDSTQGDSSAMRSR